jgi:lipopolysaccharide transport system ATP-binding protein
MAPPCIRVTDLGKRYRIASQRRPDTLRDLVVARFRRRGEAPAQGEKDVWAVRNLCLEVNEGEVVAIVGRNGSGKSTLLKLLSRITEPTEGRAEIRGRVGSLLEVGTGFHPDLTGWENIHLSATILGMRPHEISRRLPEIVAFAEVEQFLHVPVKHYSSGMYVRLGFAVAAHLEPDVLLIDEVLAVGDWGFQKKCVEKIAALVRDGRTVLYVSHNIPSVLHLCPRAVLLEAGEMVMDGQTVDVVNRYLQASTPAETPLSVRSDREGDRRLRWTGYALLDGETGQAIPQVRTGQSLRIRLFYDSAGSQSLRHVHVAVGIYGTFEQKLVHLSTDLTTGDFDELPSSGAVDCEILRCPLQPGRYTMNLWTTVDSELADWIQGAGAIEVVPGDFFGTGRLPQPGQGVVVVDHRWSARA